VLASEYGMRCPYAPRGAMSSGIRPSACLATRRAPSTGAVRGFGAFGAGAWTHACERSLRLHSRFNAFASVGAGARRRRHGPRGPSEGPFDDARVMSLRRLRGFPSSYRPRAPPVTVTTGARGLETSSPCTSLPPSPPYAERCREANARIRKTRCLDPFRRSDRIRDRSRRA
jgi:hypothetical protein